MRIQDITNADLIDFLRNELDEDRRKEIASLMYASKELRDQFREIQRIEAVIREQYRYPKADIPAEVEDKIYEMIRQTISEIRQANESVEPEVVDSARSKLHESLRLSERLVAVRPEERTRKPYVKWFSIAATLMILLTGMWLIFTPKSRPPVDHVMPGSPIIVNAPIPLDIKGLDAPSIDVKKPVINIDDNSKPERNSEPEKPVVRPRIDARPVAAEDVATKSDNFVDSIEKTDALRAFKGTKEDFVLQRQKRDFTPGDITGDGKVDIADSIMLQERLLSNRAQDLGPAADLNSDNIVDESDLNMIEILINKGK